MLFAFPSANFGKKSKRQALSESDVWLDWIVPCCLEFWLQNLEDAHQAWLQNPRWRFCTLIVAVQFNQPSYLTLWAEMSSVASVDHYHLFLTFLCTSAIADWLNKPVKGAFTFAHVVKHRCCQTRGKKEHLHTCPCFAHTCSWFTWFTVLTLLVYLQNVTDAGRSYKQIGCCRLTTAVEEAEKKVKEKSA